MCNRSIKLFIIINLFPVNSSCTQVEQGDCVFAFADLREASMPDSPTDPAAHPPQGAPVSSPNANPVSVPVVADVRSLSNNSSSPAVNGVHTSPTGPVSPTSIGNSVTQLPPACGARQLSKLKRFLTTLQQFGSDISPEIGERVRGLVMNLVVSCWH